MCARVCVCGRTDGRPGECVWEWEWESVCVCVCVRAWGVGVCAERLKSAMGVSV